MNSNQIIETLLLWNFWERTPETGIPRDEYLTRIRKYLTTDEIVTLTGVRRSGKSTLLLQVLNGLIKDGVAPDRTLYVNFDDPKFNNFLDIDCLNKIWAAYLTYLKPVGKVFLVLDEVQRINGWENWTRSMHDRKEPVKIFVTGSNAEFLKSEFSRVLTGRHLQLTVTPLSFREFLEFRGVNIKSDKLWMIKNKNKLINFSLEYIQSGGFPKAVLLKDELLRKELLTQYFNDILNRDIAARHKIKETDKLENLALFYGTNFTRKFTFNGIKKIIDFPLSLDSVHRFSGYLKDAFLIDFLPKFSYSLKNQMQTDRKIYFIDNGMREAVAFKFSGDMGKLLENAVFHQLKRQKKQIYYFHEKQEVDFVCMQGGKIVELINVCYCLENKETLLREKSALIEAMQYFKLRKSKIIVAEGDGEEIKEQGFDIQVLPFYEWAEQ